jgi:hypothetical protein
MMIGPGKNYADLVRYSRDGDQFHYLWAARRLLSLIPERSALAGIAIEGTSPHEAEGGTAITAGEVAIDIAEYDGDERREHATAIRYLQLKHSTRQVDRPWDAHGLKDTIKAFAARFREIRRKEGEGTAAKLGFWFVTNRPIAARVLSAVKDLASEYPSRKHSSTRATLAGYTDLQRDEASAFWKALHLVGGQGGREEQQLQLGLDVGSYLAGPDVSAPLQLKELVVQRLLPQSAYDPVIRRTDVLHALGVSPDDLLPAPNRIGIDAEAIPREQEMAIGCEIATSTQPVIIEAPSGVGKSVLAMRVADLLPLGSETIVYDCFGAGEYRQRAHPRHRHKDGLVQIANELAVRGLCDPLIPTPTADATAYLQAFLHRLRQAVASIRRSHQDAVVAVVIDAADNAEMGAREAGDDRSFARDLLRQPLPDGVRLVLLCRPERCNLLQPPPSIRRIKFHPFTLPETTEYLRRRHPEATTNDVREFHHRSSNNPRVQANALALAHELPAVLRVLGPNPKSVDETIAEQLQKSIQEVIDESTSSQQAQVARLCAGLAMLRPLIPLDVLAAISGTSPDMVRSFAIDFGGGRPIMVVGDAVQFRDEPVEDWFRKNYRPDSSQLSEFVERLKPFAFTSAYVAAAIPPMLLEAGRLDELIEIALSATYLPADNALQRRDVELQRLQFALRASLKSRRYLDATKLALRTGQEAAGDSRHMQLIQENTDLAGALLDLGPVQELVSRRGFTGKWLGARHVYEAALLAQKAELAEDARSRLRLAYDWLRAWTRLPSSQRRDQPVVVEEIAPLALAALRVNGAEACLRDIAVWRPKSFGYRVARTVVSCLIDGGEATQLRDLEGALIASRDLLPGLAFVDELARVGRHPTKALVQALLRRLPRKRRLDERILPSEGERALALSSVTNLVRAALHHRVGTHDRFISLLSMHLPSEPPPHWADRWSRVRRPYLAAYTLRAALAGESLDIASLADSAVRKDIETGSPSQHSENTRRFVNQLKPVFAFATLEAKWSVTPPRDAEAARNALAEVRKSASQNTYMPEHDRMLMSGEVAKLWFRLLAMAPSDAVARAEFLAWFDEPDHRPTTNIWIPLGRLAARTPHLQDLAFLLCQRGLIPVQDSGESAESKIFTYVKAARALLSLDRLEAAARLDHAIDVASRIGDEAYDRWDCILQLGERAIVAAPRRPDLAYRFGRSGEVIRGYLDKHFDWRGTLHILSGLSAEGGIAQVSRWRDRGVGWFDELLPETIASLLQAKQIDAREAAGFIGFDFCWDYPDLLERGLTAAISAREQTEILSQFIRYLKLKDPPATTWHALSSIAAKHRLPTGDLTKFAADADSEEAAAKARRAASDPSEPPKAEPRTSCHWDALFGDVQIDDPNGLAAVLAQTDSLMRSRTGPDGFWAQACARVRPGREPAFVARVLEQLTISSFDTDAFLSSLPGSWSSRLAVRAALKSGLDHLLTYNHASIWVNSQYQRVSLQVVATLLEEPECWPVEIILSAFGRDASAINAKEAFQLVSLLARMLEPAQALDGLTYAVDLIEKVLEPKDGDGPWRESLKPAAGADDALASLLWGCLGAPQAALRWQAAHTVRCLGALDSSAILDRLVSLAGGAAAGPFADARFEFYELHARLWLLMALARSAMDNPNLVNRYSKFLIRQALEGEPHVLIRQFARNAALTLHAAGVVEIDSNTLTQLNGVNRSPFQLERSNQYTTPRRQGTHRDWESRRFHFAYDMDRYWFEPLGTAFNVTGDLVQDEAEAIVSDEWGITSSGKWDEDARISARVIKDNDQMLATHGSLPRVDTLNFYLSFHALMVAAGRLLATTPAHADPDSDISRFDEWLRRQLLSRADGHWLSDRRDPVPPDARGGRIPVEDADWRWTVTDGELRREFERCPDRQVVWGFWAASRDGIGREVFVRSALVSSSAAPALLRALQTISNADDFYIPGAGDSGEIKSGEFLLKGWIEVPHTSKEFDEYDPWAGGTRYPPYAPARFVSDLLGLSPDVEQRGWHIGTAEAFRSEVWGAAKVRDADAPDAGDRLFIAKPVLQRLLNQLQLDLIVDVRIEHTVRRKWRAPESEGGHINPYSRLFLVRSDGSILTA